MNISSFSDEFYLINIVRKSCRKHFWIFFSETFWLNHMQIKAYSGPDKQEILTLILTKAYVCVHSHFLSETFWIIHTKVTLGLR
jgi:hypothetical protein